jgi:hypothetical protein
MDPKQAGASGGARDETEQGADHGNERVNEWKIQSISKIIFIFNINTPVGIVNMRKSSWMMLLLCF